MNKLMVIYGCALLSGAAIANERQNEVGDYPADCISEGIICDATELDLNEIVFIEEEDLNLGFDTADYLPKNFNPYKTYFDINSIPYVEDEDDFDLGFDTANHLPEGFDAYTDIVPVGSINYIEMEDMELGFDTKEYLPEGFSPYEFYFNLDWIPYIEDEDDLELHLSISMMKLRTKMTSK